METKVINRLYQKLAKSLPEAKPELEFTSNFELLVAVILSAQATDKSVNGATSTLFKTHNTPQAILKLGQARLQKNIQTIGLAPTKARNIIKTCKILLEKHEGEVPDKREFLEALPGVGRKTANVVLNEAFGEPTIAVDTHVFRLANRTGLANGKTVEKVEEQLMKVTPKRWLQNAHRYLILHGRYVCKAKNFSCSECVINKECEFENKLFPDTRS
ncbi:MAG: endonuclease III [Candidatus Nitronauta litoralis]|uniref:Endonuclease III n=1 Tax=Candidatus Nitronauta litoralis TaxID=2705533 RepID=A0A7T0G1D4_9BACT|nr:MAG: endonuclease III [Candidatus Nitronauta litoralis]